MKYKNLSFNVIIYESEKLNTFSLMYFDYSGYYLMIKQLFNPFKRGSMTGILYEHKFIMP